MYNTYINDFNDLMTLTIPTRLRSQRNVYLPATHTRTLLYFKCRQVNARTKYVFNCVRALTRK